MIQNSETWKWLAKNAYPLTLSQGNLSYDARRKVTDTARYSLDKDPSQNEQDVVLRCMLATLAEQTIEGWTDGRMLGGRENYDNPFSFAFDVISNEGVRIEVKTHQSNSKWISVTTGYEGDYPHGYGINLGPFMQHGIADMMFMFDVTEQSKGVYLFTPKFMAGPKAFAPASGLVQKSQGDGWYLRSCSQEEYPYHRFTSRN